MLIDGNNAIYHKAYGIVCIILISVGIRITYGQVFTYDDLLDVKILFEMIIVFSTYSAIFTKYTGKT